MVSVRQAQLAIKLLRSNQRLNLAGREPLDLEMVRLARSGTTNPNGIMPSMASNRPVPTNYDLTSAQTPPPVIMDFWCRFAFSSSWFGDLFKSMCDYNHRMLLVYSGDLRWTTEGLKNLEEPWRDCSANPADCYFWIGHSIKYIVFRPGDDKVLVRGRLADVRDYSEYDEVLDHAIQPEVVWNEALQKWIVMWEKSYFDPDMLNPEGEWGERVWYRKTRTVDEQGNLGPVYTVGRCLLGADDIHWIQDPEIPGTPGDDEPNPSPLQKAPYCYMVNMANDYYSDDGIDIFSQPDRNPLHATIVDAYNWVRDEQSGTGLEWLDEYGEHFLDNFYRDEQRYRGAYHKASIAVIGWPPFRQLAELENASYLMTYYQIEPGVGCQNVFYLFVDNPREPVLEDSINLYYHRIEEQSWDYTCQARFPWGNASSLVSFVSFWAQETHFGDWEMHYGTYAWLP
jgi:hypothetical protein